MKNLKYNFWQAIGIAFTVPSTTLLLSGAIDVSVTVTTYSFLIGVLAMVLSVIWNAYDNKEQSFIEKIAPIFLDTGANFLAAGVFLAPSLTKLSVIVLGVLLLEVFLLILYSEHIK